MRTIVQKFGGTSLATAERREMVAQKVKAAVGQGYRPVVVVSAMGRAGDPYATDTLLRLAAEAFPDASPRDLDLVASCGEVISAVVLAQTLRRHGLEVAVLTGGQAGIITDANHSRANILRVEADRLLAHLKAGRVVVVTGFQGVTETGDITTLGRGGSDTTAAAIGVALKAEVVEIYTDVDGVKTADPQLVPEARTLELMAHYELAQMAAVGARVIHPAAVELAMRHNLPMRIKSTFDDSPGTLIITQLEDPLRWPPYYSGRVVAAVTHMPQVTQLVVNTPEGDPDNRHAIAVFQTLADANISVDLINVSPTQKAFTVPEEVADRAEKALISRGYRPQVTSGCAKVTVVGMGMRGVPGVMARVVRALTEAGAPVLQTADSHVTISALVPHAHLGPAVRALHRYFGLDQPATAGRTAEPATGAGAEGREQTPAARSAVAGGGSKAGGASQPAAREGR